MSNEPATWKLKVYRLWWAEGYSWFDALVLGLSIVALGIGLGLFVAVTAVFRGPPLESDLVVIDGLVQSLAQDGNTIAFRIYDRKDVFAYSDDITAVDAAAVAMSPGVSIEVSVLQRDLANAEPNVRVWAIAVDGRVSRTFSEVSTVWYESERNNLLIAVPVILVVTLLASVPFFATAYFERRWQHDRRRGDDGR